jgi:hypothetical protein
MSVANFTVVSFIEHLGRPSEHRGTHENDLRGTGGTTSYPFVGTQTPEHNFFIDGDPDPKGAAYMIVRTFNEQDGGHHVLLNGHELILRPPAYEGLDTPGSWRFGNTVLVFDAHFLVPHSNSLKVVMAARSDDDFLVDSVVVHWHQNPFAPPRPEG